jgi:hypothetical protein
MGTPSRFAATLPGARMQRSGLGVRPVILGQRKGAQMAGSGGLDKAVHPAGHVLLARAEDGCSNPACMLYRITIST